MLVLSLISLKGIVARGMLQTQSTTGKYALIESESVRFQPEVNNGDMSGDFPLLFVQIFPNRLLD